MRASPHVQGFDGAFAHQLAISEHTTGYIASLLSDKAKNTRLHYVACFVDVASRANTATHLAQKPAHMKLERWKTALRVYRLAALARTRNASAAPQTPVAAAAAVVAPQLPPPIAAKAVEFILWDELCGKLLIKMSDTNNFANVCALLASTMEEYASVDLTHAYFTCRISPNIKKILRQSDILRDMWPNGNIPDLRLVLPTNPN